MLTDPGTFEPVEIEPDDVAVIQYTGGTTGTPKGAMLTHANVYLNVEQIAAWAPALGYGREKSLGCLPFFHVFAMTVIMNLGVKFAAELFLMPRFVLNDALDLIHKNKLTVLAGVPTLFNAMLNHPRISSYDLSSIKFVISGGAALPAEIKQAFDAATGCSVVEGYGLSEASPVVTCNPLDGSAPRGSIGLPLPGTILSAPRPHRSHARSATVVSAASFASRGRRSCAGYWNKPAETAAQFAGPCLRTGDVGIMDENGFFFIVDRIKDLIICSGYNVYPRRIEEALYEHAAVEEAVVIGIADKYRGEAPKAFVKLKAGQEATRAVLMAHLETKISKLELPVDIVFRDALPKTIIGKLSKKELKAEELQKSRGS